jgi:glycosyltransferase involved in cell wall biosynthesis
MKQLSVLIPVYNYDITLLVKTLYAQLVASSIDFEILCYDDASPEIEISQNNQDIIRFLPNVIYWRFYRNVGRSKTRNLLAKNAQYDTLLFLDGDATVVKSDYIATYLLTEIAQQDVVIGGTCYAEELPSQEVILRWKYGREREMLPAAMRQKNPYHSFTLFNTLIKKSIFLQYPLDETVLTYGHEDTQLGYVLQRAKISILHIDNPLQHSGLETASVFLNKTQQAVKNFYVLAQEKGIGKDTALYKAYTVAKPFSFVFMSFYELLEDFIMKNLTGKNPNIRYLDLYKLYYFLEQKNLSSCRNLKSLV